MAQTWTVNVGSENCIEVSHDGGVTLAAVRGYIRCSALSRSDSHLMTIEGGKKCLYPRIRIPTLDYSVCGLVPWIQVRRI